MDGNIFTTIFKWVSDHLSPRFLVVFLVLLGFILFNPWGILQYFGLELIAKAYRPYFAIGFLFSGILLLTYLFSWVWNSGWILYWRRRRAIRWYMHHLSPDEIQLLLKYVDRHKQTLKFMPDDGVVQHLENQSILYRSANVGNLVSGFSYTITPWAKHYLKPKNFQKLLNKLDRQNM